MLCVLLEEVRCIKENVTLSMTLGNMYNERTETGMVPGIKKEKDTHKPDFSVVTSGSPIQCHLLSARSL